MIDFPASDTAVICLLDVLTTTQRLTTIAGACTATAVAGATSTAGWRFEEILDSLDTLVEWRYLFRARSERGDTYHAGPRSSGEEG